MSDPIRRDMIGIGASAGGVPMLIELLPLLPKDFPAAVLIVIHRHPTAESKLAEVLGWRSALPVSEPTDAAPVEAGHVYVAPRDHHMTVVNGRVRLDRLPKQHHTRPAIDPLFYSLALYRRRSVGIILSGTREDGVLGLIAIKGAGGFTIAQDPGEAPFPSLPLNAIVADNVDKVMRIREIAPLLAELSRDGAATREPPRS